MTAKGKFWIGLLLLAGLVLLSNRLRTAQDAARQAREISPVPPPLPSSPAVVPRPVSLHSDPAMPLPPPPYADAAVMDEVESAPDRIGLTQRTRLLKGKGKYPYIRVEERRRADPAGGEPISLSRVAMVADHILVQLHADASETMLAALNAQQGGTIRRRLKRPGLYLISFASFDMDTVPLRVAAYRTSPAIAAVAEPDFLVEQADTLPDDPRYGEMWGMIKIRAAAAWDIETGHGSVVVGMIDSGANMLHEDLVANLWVNPGENPTNGIDDDANGYIDDVHGWDFGNDDADPTDHSGHGTHTAGTVAAVGNNSTGVVGVSWSSKLMILKMFSDAGSGQTSDAIDALQYAITMQGRGVPIRVTNNSWGGGGYSVLLKAAIEASGDAGLLFIAAAGNFGQNNDIVPFYPATYDSGNIISVAASTTTDTLASYSHSGATTVDVAAPGNSILSTTGSGYANNTGTSMASPHVAGACALLWELYPEATWQQIRSFVMAGVATNAPLVGQVVSGGRLDVAGAMDVIPPVIDHIPLVNTTNTVDDHVIQATVTPLSLLAPGFPRLLWKPDGTTNGYVTNLMTHVTNSLYEAVLPVQPIGGGIRYYIEAETIGGIRVTHPLSAPAQEHHFQVVESVLFWVSGYPSALGVVAPDYGIHYMASGLTVQASAELLANVTPEHRYECVGWVAIGSAPSGGDTNTVTFVLDGITALEWQWEPQVSLVESSSPTGLVSGLSWWESGGMGATTKAPDPLMVSSSVYRFVEWQIDGARWPMATNVAANPAAQIAMTTSRQAVALYMPANENSDGDGLPDWWERHYFGSLTPVDSDDLDGDGFRNDEELADGTNPRDSGSYPTPPQILHTPLADPLGTPAPWPVTAVVTDNYSVASVTLHWRRLPQAWSSLAMTSAVPDQYEATIPAPGLLGETYEYRIEALDPAGYWTSSAIYRFDVVYPVLGLSTAAVEAVLLPNTFTNVVLALTNSGNTGLNWTAEPGWQDGAEQGSNGVIHGGANDAWHITTNRAYSGTRAWYCGGPLTPLYADSVNAWLQLPPLEVVSGSELAFRHWAKIEYDTGRNDNHYWDGGIVELSTNGGLTFVPIDPVGGYPHLITPNPGSPFAFDTPCFGGDGSGWDVARFDLSAFAGATAVIRLRFGSDEFVVDEGWYIDDIAVIPASDTNGWLSVAPAFGSVAAGAGGAVTVRLDSAAIPTGDFPGVVRFLTDDPLRPTNAIPVQMWVRSPPELSLLGAAQTATDGSGRVSITNDLWDVDGELCSIELTVMTSTGVWEYAWMGDGTSQWGAVTVNSNTPPQLASITTLLAQAPTTNRVTSGWMTQAGPMPIQAVTTAVVRARAWDGRYWSAMVQSAPFLVDNEPPSAPTGLAFSAYTNGTWATNRAFGLRWDTADDGGGVGLAGYALDHGVSPSAQTNGVVDSVTTNGVEVVGSDGSNWWFDVRAVDAFGNVGAAVSIGPARVDTEAPDASGAFIDFERSPYGNYTVGSIVTSSWSGITDNLSGVTGYYVGWTNGNGTTAGVATVSQTAVLVAAQGDATNTLYVWARDEAGWIGNAAMAPILVLVGTNDFDVDGFSTDEESIAGTDASASASRFVLTSAASGNSPSGRVVVLTWAGLSNRTYALYGRTSLVDLADSWLPLPEGSNLIGSSGSMSYTDQVESVVERFYRLTVQ
ncbi:MAG: S8 family serine peptidase [Lentisphaerae bacterium]|nr:S8 family serine peptidase [Lentisphaerota bacterium]